MSKWSKRLENTVKTRKKLPEKFKNKAKIAGGCKGCLSHSKIKMNFFVFKYLACNFCPVTCGIEKTCLKKKKENNHRMPCGVH